MAKIFLKNCRTGSIISFPGKRKKYRVRDHAKPFLEIIKGYVNGKNYIEHPGTHLYNSSGRIIHTKSNQEVIIHSS